MPVLTDQTGRIVSLPAPPQRIISLVPSQTELLYELGLNDRVIGITKFCIRPEEWFNHKTRVGGTKEVNIDMFHQLAPDLIIANKEENVKVQVEELAKHYPVWVTDVNNLEDAYEMIRQTGKITDKEETAAKLTLRIKESFSGLTTNNLRLKTCYLIWKNPWMAAGGGTFINDMLKMAGFINVFDHTTRYPEVTLSQLQETNPELVLLSSEPFPFKQNHVDELQAMLPGAKILLVDGQLFSWYGSRLVYAPAYFRELINLLG